MDAYTYGMRESVKHVPNYRIKAITKDKEWTVDVYRGGFYHAQVEGWSEQFKSIHSLLIFLRQRLQV